LIVEFIGSTGAGKTTLIREVRRKLEPQVEVCSAFEQVAGPLGLRGVSHPSVRNLTQEVLSLPAFLGSLGRNREFLAHALKMLKRQAGFSLFTLNILRSLERKLGVHEVLRRRGGEAVVLVDEGTLLAAHNIFVFSEAQYSDDEIVRFAELAPLPDLAVYIKAPVESLVQRSLARRDPPREMRSRDPGMVRRHVVRAVEVFDQLVQAEPIRSRLLAVENCDLPDPAGSSAADQIVTHIIQWKRKAERV
jgi:thymidylate kinase